MTRPESGDRVKARVDFEVFADAQSIPESRRFRQKADAAAQLRSRGLGQLDAVDGDGSGSAGG